MVFSSLPFLFFFLPAVLAAYFIVPQRFLGVRNLVLLLFSLGFYFYGEPRLIVIMLLSILINYVFGLLVTGRMRRLCMAICVVLNLGLLGLFKYADFFLNASNTLLHTQFALLGIVMPIGISFFTFQALSYVIDVYRGQVQPQRSLPKLALYISMFPQLIAGPIVRYKDINQQLSERTHSFASFSAGIDRFIYGLAKKVLLSNVFGLIADRVFALPAGDLSFLLAWFGAICYTMQIYFDFSGYSDMAIGLGRMFGFTFLENFNYPYISRSVTDFWRRWHISLSTWFRDYVYIPLGGNRCGAARQLVNLLIVWTLTGFWHGANYTFLLWGLYFGVLLILEKNLWLDRLNRLPAVFSHLYALLFIVLGWVIFRSDTVTYALQYMQVMFTPSLYADRLLVELVHRYALPVLCGVVLCTPVFTRLEKTRVYRALSPLVLAGLLLLSVMSLVTNSYNPFIYFRF